MAYTRANKKKSISFHNLIPFGQDHGYHVKMPRNLFTYNATIKAPKQLMAAMSAEGPRKKNKKMVSIILNKSIQFLPI
jgi:hypothetical protein